MGLAMNSNNKELQVNNAVRAMKSTSGMCRS